MEHKEFIKIRNKEWENAKKKFIRDRDFFENHRIRHLPKLLKFMGKLTENEKTIFYRAWWMGFFEGENYGLRLIKR